MSPSGGRNALVPASVVLLLLLAAPVASARPGMQLAVVIGNNNPDSAGRSPLRYADDDAVAMHRLFLEAGARSYLLVSPDADTRALNPQLAVAGRPRWRDLDRVIVRLAAALKAEAGRTAEVIFYYSGHGDVADGEGYLTLEDRRLTRALLFEGVLARLPAARRHVIVDACKSYFLAAPRGPGGTRTAVGAGFLATRRAALVEGTGFLLSTSSARDSHEWERYQAGVFSHGLRSAVRGGADVNGDGAVTYAEVGAFLQAAGRSIANPLLRPEFTLRAPARGLEAPLLVWSTGQTAGGPTRLLVDRDQGARLFIESASGLRLADLPPTRGGLRSVRVPAERPLYLRRADDDLEYVITAPGDAQVSQLTLGPAHVARRGALNAALERLFSTPFGTVDVGHYRASYSQELIEEMASRQARLDDAASAARRQRWRRWSGIAAVSAGALALSLGAVAIERYVSGSDASQVERDRRNPVIRGLGVASGVLGGVAAGAGISWLVLTVRGRGDTNLSVGPALPMPGAIVSVRAW